MASEWTHHLEQTPHRRTGVLHIGAHNGREVSAYRRIGYQQIHLAEPLPQCVTRLEALSDVMVHPYAVSSTPGPRTFHVPNATQLSSLHKPLEGRFKTVEVQAVTLSSILDPAISVVVVDVQGAEVDVLASGNISQCDLVVAESSLESRYEGGATTETLDDFMESQGFEALQRIPHRWVDGGFDTIYRCLR